MSGPGGAGSPEPPGGFFPAVYDELKRLAAARLSGEGFRRVALGGYPPRAPTDPCLHN